MANTLLSIQVIPSTSQGEHPYTYVDHAIKVIEQSGVKYQVNPLETTMEGELEDLLHIVSKIHIALVEAGSPSIISQIKIAHSPLGFSMETLTEKYR